MSTVPGMVRSDYHRLVSMEQAGHTRSGVTNAPSPSFNGCSQSPVAAGHDRRNHDTDRGWHA